MARKKKEDVKPENPHTGSTFDSFLEEEGIKQEVSENAAKKTTATQSGDWTIEKIKVFKTFALGIAKDDNIGLWFLIKIPFDLNTMTVGAIEKIGQGEIRAIINERFVITAATELDVSS